jgi:hypothetical protein
VRLGTVDDCQVCCSTNCIGEQAQCRKGNIAHDRLYLATHGEHRQA